MHRTQNTHNRTGSRIRALILLCLLAVCPAGCCKTFKGCSYGTRSLSPWRLTTYPGAGRPLAERYPSRIEVDRLRWRTPPWPTLR
jgi:hypothetical protein